MGFSYIAFDDVFLDRFAQGFWERHRGESVGDIWIFLPSVRSVDALKRVLIRRRPQVSSAGSSFLLPKIIPLGELHLSSDVLGFIQQHSGLPEAIGTQAFTLMVLEACLKIFPQEMAQPSRLVEEFIKLHQQAVGDEVDWRKLGLLVPDSYAQHWQYTLGTLEQLLETVTQRLKGRLDPASFQMWVHHQLQHLLPKHWSHPIYMVGSTGSLPSIRRLHRTIGYMAQGQVILPGWDSELIDHPLPSLTHPLSPLVLWRQGIGVASSEVVPWHHTPTRVSAAVRAFSQKDIVSDVPSGKKRETSLAVSSEEFVNIPHYTASYEYEEARFIAAIARKFLEESSEAETLAVVTPCPFLREMIQRYAALWGVQFTDDTPLSLQDTMAWDLLIRLMKAHQTNHLSDIIGFLRHPYIRRERVEEDLLTTVDVLARQQGISSFGGGGEVLTASKGGRHQEALREAIGRLQRLWEKEAPVWIAKGSWKQWILCLKEHIDFWIDPSVATEDFFLLKDLFQQATPQITTFYQLSQQQVDSVLKPFLETLGRQISWKKPLKKLDIPPHKRLLLLGPLETRLLSFSRVIIAGLNDGIWPREPTSTAWLSESMRVTLGFGSYERETGQSAHDFINCLHHPKVLLTRSEERQGNPATPSFFWTRVTGAEPTMLTSEDGKVLSWVDGTWAKKLDVETVSWPCPPVSARPRKFSATRIDLLQRNPYEFYCRQILQLSPLPPWGPQFSALDYGVFVHRALENFLKEGALSANRLRQLGDDQWAQMRDPWIRKVSSLKFNCSVEILWQMIQEDRPLRCMTEQTGSISLVVDEALFELNAKADRIDLLGDGTVRIVDYKTGTLPSRKDVLTCQALQLSVEALIHQRGGFYEGNQAPLGSLAYWRLTPAFPGLEIRQFSAQEVEIILTNIESHVEELLRAFQSPLQPYIFMPQPRMGYDPYQHLSRWEP